MLVRVRVKAKNFRRLESTGQPPKRKGGKPGRVAVPYEQGAELTIQASVYEAHKGTFQLLGKDLRAESGKGKTPTSAGDELDALRAEAESLGLTVDKRWREGRLRDEISARRAELGEDPDDDGTYLDAMDEAELREYAKKNGIGLDGLEGETEIREAIEEALGIDDGGEE